MSPSSGGGRVGDRGGCSRAAHLEEGDLCPSERDPWSRRRERLGGCAFAGQLLQPVFQGGRIWFNFQASKAREQQALVAYEQAIRTAFREVSDALVAYRRTREFRGEQEALTASLIEYARLSTLRYRGGVASYLEVLDAERQLFSAELDLARARREELLAVVQLYKALGGGWQMEAAPAAAEQKL